MERACSVRAENHSLKSSLTLVDREAAKAALGDRALVAIPGYTLVLGRVSWHVPPELRHGGTYTIALIDKRTNRKAGLVAVGRTPESAGIGHGDEVNAITDRYSWLTGIGYSQLPDGSWQSHGDLIWAREDASPVIFAARLPDIARTPCEVSDLLLALIYIGPKQQIYWAQRLEG